MSDDARTSRVLAVVRWPVGGIRTYVRYNYPTLAAAGYRFTFVGPDDGGFRGFADEFAAWNGAEFVAVPVRHPRCRLWPTVRRLLREDRFDLVHSHGMIAACHAAAANWGRRVPHVVTSHDVIRPCQTAGVKGRAKLWLLEQFLSRANAVVAVSDDVRDNLLESLPRLRTSSCRVESILNGIDTAHFSADGQHDGWLRRQLDVADDVYLIGFLGRFMEQKGFLPLLDALQRLADSGPTRPYRVVAVGSGDCEQRYHAEVERRGLAPLFCFLDFIPDVAPVLRQLDLLVMPSLWEAGPILPMEAMCVGLPVLGSGCIGLREVLRGSPSRMVPAGDANAWCRALRQALAEPWTEAARAYIPEARRRFDVLPAAAQLRELFDDLLASQPRNRHGRRVRGHPLLQRREVPAALP